tara:strand:+ start:835 stop:1116 length:282 start_codon:yes stop_codon:yes gene_type:complete
MNYDYKNWYLNNKEYLQTKITCCCGSSFNRIGLKKHLNNKKHNDYIKSIMDYNQHRLLCELIKNKNKNLKELLEAKKITDDTINYIIKETKLN